MGIPPRSEEWLSAQSPGMRAHLSAFVAGINDFARAHPEMVSDSVRAVLPVVETDVMGHVQQTLFGLFIASRNQANEETRGWKERGSNAWAVAPSRSASGKSLLLANPHLPWGDIFTWMEAQVVMPGLDLYGALLVGSPVLQIAFNDHLGWTHTVNTQDGNDLYELTLEGDGYSWDGGVRRFETERSEFFERVRRRYLDRAAQEPQRFRVIDASGTPDDVEAGVRAALEPWVGQPTRAP